MGRAIRFRNKNLHSSFEKRVLEDLVTRGVWYDYEPYKLAYELVHKYTPDLVLAGGTIVELKGYFSQEDRSKMLAVKKNYPNMIFKFVFQRAGNTISKRPGAMTYGEWAERHGFEWAEGTIPASWLTTIEKQAGIH